jgi:hypothetical protein
MSECRLFQHCFWSEDVCRDRFTVKDLGLSCVPSSRRFYSSLVGHNAGQFVVGETLRPE